MSIENDAHSDQRIKWTGWAAVGATVGIAGVVALSGSLRTARADRHLDQSASGIAAGPVLKSAPLQGARDESRLHDEVQYFGDKFSEEHQRLHSQPVAVHVQAF